MAQLRKRLRKGASSGKSNHSAHERFVRAKSRQVMKAYRRKRTPITEKSLLIAKCRPSAILDSLISSRHNRWVPLLKRQRLGTQARVSLKRFSFLSDPKGTMKAIKAVGEAELSAYSATLDFDDEHCLDIGAYLVLAECWPAMAAIYRGGRMMPPVQSVLKAVGLNRPLNMSLRFADADNVWAFPLQRRRPAGTSRSLNVHLEPQRREKTTDGLVAAIDEWIGQPPLELELTEEGRAWIAMIAGELLDNAERHSHRGGDGDWSIAAFMTRRDEEQDGPSFSCHLAFLSVGETISESLKSAADEIAVPLKRYCAMHRSTGMSEEALRTVFALQDGVTRDPAAARERRGGTGFQEVLDLLNMLGSTSRVGRGPRAAILSGRTCIRLESPYIQGVRRKGDTSPRELWFNGVNAHTSPPDPNFVFELEEGLAGTLITMAFNLDPEYLRAPFESKVDQ